MPAAPIPPPFERLGGRRFSFYPPIQNVAANEWTFRAATWSEILVRNTTTSTDLWLPRRWVGAGYETEYGAAVITLLDQLEFRDGVVRPYRCRVIAMPSPAGDPARSPCEERGPAAVVSIRLETRNDSRAGRFAGGAVALGVLGCLAVAGYSLQGGDLGRRSIVSSLGQTYLALTGTDTFQTALHTLGAPHTDRVILIPDGHRLRLADYPDRGFRAVFLKQIDAPDLYLGSVDESGRVLQSVRLPGGGTSDRLLRFLESF